MKENNKRIWITGAMTRQAATLPENSPYWNAIESIAKLSTSTGMKHVLGCWALSLAQEGKKIPDKLLSRKKSAAFAQSFDATLQNDLGAFRISSLIAIVCAVLDCMFLRAVMLDQYLFNFSIDALVAAAAAAGLLMNLRTSFHIVRIYGKTRDFLLTDVLALVLWYLLFLLMPQFDMSLLVFLLAYWFENRRLKQMMKTFASENGMEQALHL